MTIKKKLLLAFLSTALLVLVIGGSTIIASLQAEEDSEGLVSGTNQEIDALLSLSYYLELSISNMREVALEYSKEYHGAIAGLEHGEIEQARTLINRGISGARESLNKLEAAITHWADHGHDNEIRNEAIEFIYEFTDLKNALLPHLKRQENFLVYFDTKDRMAAYEYFERTIKPEYKQIAPQVLELIEDERLEAKALAEEIFAHNHQTIIMNAIAILAAFLGAISLGLLVSSSITKPLEQLRAATSDISKGNLDQHIAIHSSAELNSLALTFNDMTAALKSYRDEMEQRIESRTQELHQAKQTAEAASDAKSQFLSRVSHELRTPLNAILGFGQLLQQDETDKEKQEQIECILSAGHHLLQLINEVLDISRIDAGEMELNIEPVPLDRQVAECLSLVRHNAENREIKISTDLESNLSVQADPMRLNQVLLNLLSNAIKYNKHGGVILIKQRSTDQGTVRIEVADTGQGIPSSQQYLVFEPFTRVAADKATVEGTGIGLSITKRLVDLMDGTIGFESEEGKGSTFWVELPQSALANNESEATGNVMPFIARQESAITRQYGILYVEDDPASIRVLEYLFKQRPQHRLVAVNSAEEGLAKAAQHPFDLIILDINLPGMDGYEALEKLQALPNTSDIPVIALSANAMPEDVEKGIDRGFRAYLTKPLDIHKLFNTIDGILPTQAKASKKQ